MKSKLILGTVQMGLSYGINNNRGQISPEDSFEILREAFDRGITTLDTAEAYGDAHQVIGNFHHENPLIRFEVITKLPHVIDEDLNQKVESYLKELNVDHLEALLFHSFKTYEENRDNKDTLRKFKVDGLVKNLGVSIYTNEEFTEVIGDEDIDVIQIPYNVFDNWIVKGELIKKARSMGKKIHTRSCFLQGLFFQPLDSEKPIVRQLNTELRQLHDISHRFDCSIQQLALTYCTSEPQIDNVLIGVDSVEQLKQNITESEWSMSEDLLQELNRIQVSDLRLVNPSLWNTL